MSCERPWELFQVKVWLPMILRLLLTAGSDVLIVAVRLAARVGSRFTLASGHVERPLRYCVVFAGWATIWLTAAYGDRCSTSDVAAIAKTGACLSGLPPVQLSRGKQLGPREREL